MSLRVTVVGDLLLDRDVVGTVERVCPDAPVPVLDVDDDHARPGGAGLAAALLAADGHDVTVVVPVGDDPAGSLAARLLTEAGVHVVALPTAGSTREKVRVRAGGQSLVRVDRGTRCPPGGLSAAARSALDSSDAVLVADYGGGTTTDPDVREVLTAAAARRPVVWDPHPRGARPVAGVRMATPNRAEAAALSGLGSDPSRPLAATQRQAERLLATWQAHAVCVTLGATGALLTYGSGAPLVVPAAPAEGGDTCGAGDRFAATATAVLAGGDVVSAAVERAVDAASRFVACGGAYGFAVGRTVQQPTPVLVGAARLSAVRAAGGTVVATGGCFDLLHAGHISLLRAARHLGDALVVLLNSDDSVRRLKGPGRPVVPQADRTRVLEALECVDDVVVFDEGTPEEALRRLRPDVWAKGGDYALADLPEAAVMAEWGGQTVVLPYLDGRSTTALIGAAGHRAPTGKEPA